MELITKAKLLKDLPGKYKAQYPNDRRLFDGTSSDAMLKRLESETQLTEQRAIEIIGNITWTRIRCDECMKDVDAAIVLGGGNDDYDSESVQVCYDCLKKATNQLTGAA